MKKKSFLFVFLLSSSLYAYNPTQELIQIHEEKINQNCKKNDSDCALKIILDHVSLEDIYKANERFYESHKQDILKKFTKSYHLKPNSHQIKKMLPASQLKKIIREYYKKTNSTKQCLRRRNRLSHEYDPWSGNSKYLRFLKTSGYSKKFLEHYSIDPYVMSCLTMRESNMLPSSLNQTYCHENNRSSAIGLSMITKTTLGYLYNIKGFRSKISRYKDFKKHPFIFDRLTQDPELQIEMGMAILWFVKLQHKNSRKHLRSVIDQYQDPLQKKTYKIYASILSSYYGHKCNYKKMNYATKILQCSQCLKKTKNMKLNQRKLYKRVERCLAQVYDSSEETREIQRQCRS